MARTPPISGSVLEEGGQAVGLADRLREATSEHHRRAERSGVVRELLRGSASPGAYALLLRSLVPAYRALELGFARHPELADASPGLRQAAALEKDLSALAGASWRRSLPVLRAARTYAARVEGATEGDGLRLLPHAYVRYFGDLNGGRILGRVLSRTLDLPASALNFYAFAEIEDLEAFIPRYRRAFERVAQRARDREDLVEEAVIAFELNIAVSEAVQAAQALEGGLRPMVVRP